jgi:hypothetical protein
MINETEKALNLLSDEGYYVRSLWHIDDVMNKYKCTKQQALNILEDALDGELLVEEVFNRIDMFANKLNLEINENYNV